MRWGALLAACFALVLVAPRPVAAQTTSALVVASCGSQSYTAGQPAPITIDSTGLQCGNSSGGGGATVGFSPTGQASLTATSSSSRVAFGSVGPTALITNNGAVTAFINFGNSSVTATTSSYPVNPGQSIAFNIGTNTNVAAITASSTAALSITTGTGIPTVSGVVATPSNPTTVTVNAPPNDVTTGPTGCTTTTCLNALTVSTAGAGSMGVQITGSGSGMSFTFEGSVDSTNFVAIQCSPAGTTNGQVSTGSANGVWACPVSGMKLGKVVWSGLTSGTVTETLNASAGSSGATSTTTISGKNGGNATTLAVDINGDVILSPDTTAACSALCSNLPVKTSAGTLKSFEVEADGTLSGSQWYVMIFNATSAPADGAVTPVKCYAQASGVVQMGGSFNSGGISFGTGITIVASSGSSCFNKTASTHAFIGADYQ